MEKVIDLMPHLESKKAQVYAVITIPALQEKPASAKRSPLRAAAELIDAVVSFALGGVLLIFLLLLMISL